MKKPEPNGEFRRYGVCHALEQALGGWSPGLVAVVGSLACLTALAEPAWGQGSDSSAKSQESGYERFAEIYVDRFYEPGEELKLKASGLSRSKALAHHAHGLSLESQGRTEQAIAEYRKVLEIDPAVFGLAQKVAAMLAQNGKTAEARKILEEAVAKNPGQPQGYIVLSEYLATFHADSEEDRDRAMRLAEEAVEKFPGVPLVYEHLVNFCLVARQQEKAKEILTKALEREEKNPHYWLRMAEVAKTIWPLSMDKNQEPVLINSVYEKALGRAPKDELVKQSVADYYHASHQPKRARDLYLELIEEHPDRLDIRQNLAKVYGALQNEDKVIETLRGIVQINPQDAETHRELGRIFLGREDVENAILHYRQALGITKGSVAEFVGLANLLISVKRVEEAIRLLDRGIYLYPSDPRLPGLLAVAHSGAENWEKAVPWFEKTIELASQSQPAMLDTVFFFRYGIAVERKGDIDAAADLFRKSIDLLDEIDTETPDGKKFRAQLYNYLGYMWIENDKNIDQAGELIKNAAELDPTSGAIADSLGWFYFKKGDYPAAKRELAKAADILEEPDAVIFDHLAQACHKLGEKEKAIEYVRKALELDPDNQEYQARLKEFESSNPPAPPQSAPAKPKTKTEGDPKKEEPKPSTPEEPEKKAA